VASPCILSYENWRKSPKNSERIFWILDMKASSSGFPPSRKFEKQLCPEIREKLLSRLSDTGRRLPERCECFFMDQKPMAMEFSKGPFMEKSPLIHGEPDLWELSVSH
jgi:hypothetical protein